MGDSGGPLFDVAGTEPLLIAITSRGIGGCGADDVGLYVRVDVGLNSPEFGAVS